MWITYSSKIELLINQLLWKNVFAIIISDSAFLFWVFENSRNIANHERKLAKKWSHHHRERVKIKGREKTNLDVLLEAGLRFRNKKQSMTLRFDPKNPKPKKLFFTKIFPDRSGPVPRGRED